jgi:hypothetical protein
MIKRKILMEIILQEYLWCIQVVRVENIILEVHSKQDLETQLQDQYIGFNVGSAILLGSAPDNLTDL